MGKDPEYRLLFPKTINDPIHQQGYRDCSDHIHKGMLLQKYGGKGNQNSKYKCKHFDRRMFQSPGMPGAEAHAERSDHMQAGADIGIGIKAIEPGYDPGQDIIPGKFRYPQLLAGRVDHIEDKRPHEGNA